MTALSGDAPAMPPTIARAWLTGANFICRPKASPPGGGEGGAGSSSAAGPPCSASASEMRWCLPHSPTT